MALSRILKGVAALTFATSLWAAPALAQVQLTAVPAAIMKGRTKVAIPAYEITFMIEQQATAAASIGARTRLKAQITGVDPATMKKLTNEAYADLRAKLTAAGVPLVEQAMVTAATAGVERLPGNQDIQFIGKTITIGKGVAKGWASFGADEAPAIKAFHNPSASPMAMMAARGGANALSPAIKSLDAVMLVPNLNIDFIDMAASSSFGVARAGGKLNFVLRAFVTKADVVGQGAAGPAYAMGATLNKDVSFATAGFATVQEGDVAVRQLIGANTIDSNYLSNPSARGDAIAINGPVWEGLVRQAFGAYNTALVATIVKARG